MARPPPEASELTFEPALLDSGLLQGLPWPLIQEPRRRCTSVETVKLRRILAIAEWGGKHTKLFGSPVTVPQGFLRS